jgi:tRNA/rRNA methyltransferase
MKQKEQQRVNLNNIAIVLNQPRFPENIGSTARAMRNMGINRLIVVSPQNCDLSKVLKLATHAAYDVIENMMEYHSLADALASFNYIVGTTARLGGYRFDIQSPRICANHLIEISYNNDIAIVFGPEDRGLTNNEVKRCHALVNIPTAAFSSLNLSQAVMVFCYELFVANSQSSRPFVPKLADHHELERMYRRLEDVLTRIDFINHENPDHWMNNIRRFFSRLSLRSRDVRVILGICRQMDWYVGCHTNDSNLLQLTSANEA